MDKARDLADRQHAVVEIAGVEGGLETAAGGQRRDLLKGRAVSFKLRNLCRQTVVEHARRVGEAPQHQRRAHLIGVQGHGLLAGAQRGGLLREEEARADRRALAAEHQRRGEPASVAHAAAGDHGDVQRVHRRRPEHHRADVVLADMAGRLRAVHDDGVAADRLRLERVLDDRALVDDGHPRALEIGHESLGRAAGGLHDADALLDADADVGRIVRRRQRGHQRQIYGEGLVRQLPAFADLSAQILGRAEGGGGHHAQAARVRHGRDELGLCQPLHRAGEDRTLDPEHFGYSCVQPSFHSFLTPSHVGRAVPGPPPRGSAPLGSPGERSRSAPRRAPRSSLRADRRCRIP